MKSYMTNLYEHNPCIHKLGRSSGLQYNQVLNPGDQGRLPVGSSIN